MNGHDAAAATRVNPSAVRRVSAAVSRSVLIARQGSRSSRYTLPSAHTARSAAVALRNSSASMWAQYSASPVRTRSTKLPLGLARLAAVGHDLAEVAGDLRGGAVDEVAEGGDQVLVDGLADQLPGEVGVVALGRVRHEEPAPAVGRQQVERLVHEDAAALRGRELPAVVRQPVERLELVDQLPRLARARAASPGNISVWKGTLSLPMNSV